MSSPTVRRRLLSLILRPAVVGVVGFVAFAAPFLVAAQPSQKVFRVGHLAQGGRTPDGAPPQVLRDALRALGYVESQSVTYESRFAEGRVERLPGLATELVRLKVDVIVAQGGLATEAARQATSTIPIVMAPAGGDAAALGWIAALARPGANVTGLTDESIQLSASHKIPATYELDFIVREGGLMSYGPRGEDAFREAAGYIDRILKGAKPADLPAMQPTRYHLAVNVKTATALGLTIPQSLLLRADDLVQ